MEPRVDIYNDVYERHHLKTSSIIEITTKLASHKHADEMINAKYEQLVRRAFDNAYYSYNDTLLYQLMDRINGINPGILQSWLKDLPKHVLIKFIRKFHCHKNFELINQFVRLCDVDALKTYRFYHGARLSDSITESIELYIQNDCKDFARIAKHLCENKI